MPGWKGSDRRSRLPDDWSDRRLRVFDRDGHRCTYRFPNGGRCPERENLECDHVAPGDNHDLSNLTTLCKRHHQMKSSREGAAGLKAKRKAIEDRFGRKETHPGLLVASGGLRSGSPSSPRGLPRRTLS